LYKIIQTQIKYQDLILYFNSFVPLQYVETVKINNGPVKILIRRGYEITRSKYQK